MCVCVCMCVCVKKKKKKKKATICARAGMSRRTSSRDFTKHVLL